MPPLLARAVATKLCEVLELELNKPIKKVISKNNANVLQIKMVEAAEKYGVNPHVIEPRVKQEMH